MADFDNTNRGVLFKKSEKKQPNHSDYDGTLNVEGREYFLNGWIKTAKSGKTFLSLSVKAKQAKPVENRPADDSGGIHGMQEDIPF